MVFFVAYLIFSCLISKDLIWFVLIIVIKIIIHPVYKLIITVSCRRR